MTENSNQSSIDIAIIGGGYCGVLVAVHLMRKHQQSKSGRLLNISIVKGTEQLARGAAYSTKCPYHLLNVPAEGMSALADEPEHFLDWLRNINPGVSPQGFVSRSLYGNYIQSLFEETVANNPDSVKLSIVEERAAGVAVRGAKAELFFVSGKSLVADKVVLALGNFLPSDTALSAWFDTCPERLHKDPWAADALSGIKPQDNVLLVGTGLTMMDMVIQLRSLEHEGRLIAVSRHGYTPTTHKLFHRLENLPTAEQLLPSQFSRNVLKLFRDIRICAQSAPDWRLVINALRPHTQSIWKSLDSAERRRFLRHVRPIWDVLRHRCAPSFAHEIDTLRQNGKLAVIAGRITDIRHEDDAIEIEISPRGSKTHVGMSVDHVINCTGPATDFRTSKFPLIVSLRDHGLIKPDQLGMGIEVGEDFAVIGQDGQASTVLFALGSLLKGALWETTAVPELRQQAKQVADSVLTAVSEQVFTPQNAAVDVNPL